MKLLLKREYKKQYTLGSLSLHGKLLCKTLEASPHQLACPCPEGLFRLAIDYEEEQGWHLYFEADGRRFKIKGSKATVTKDCIVPVTCFKKSIPMFTRLACTKLNDRLMQCMEEGEEVWLEIYSEFKPSNQTRWKSNPQNTLQAQEA